MADVQDCNNGPQFFAAIVLPRTDDMVRAGKSKANEAIALSHSRICG